MSDCTEPDRAKGPRLCTDFCNEAESLKIVEHQFRPTTGVKAADDYIRQAVAEVMEELAPLITERITLKMALLLEAKRLPPRIFK